VRDLYAIFDFGGGEVARRLAGAEAIALHKVK
jgi:hypothetical protein